MGKKSISNIAKVLFQAIVFVSCFMIISNAYSQEANEKKDDVLLFQTTGTISTKQNTPTFEYFYKGVSTLLPIKQNTRYGVLINSQTLDSVVRLNVEGKVVFRDIFLGKNAGILFYPSDDFFNSQDKNPYATITSLFHIPQRQKVTNEDESNILNEYTLSVYEINSVVEEIITFPFTNNTLSLKKENSIMGKIAKEYALTVPKGKRIYAFMYSQDFDTLLEFSNRYGEIVASDDWVKTDDFFTSLASILLSHDDTYYLIPTSFSGKETGSFSLHVVESDNEKLFAVNDVINKNDAKIFDQYIKEYPLSLQKDEVRTITLQAFSHPLTVIFANTDRSTIYSEKAPVGKNVEMPIFAQQEGEYKIIILNNSQATANYTLSVYK